MIPSISTKLISSEATKRGIKFAWLFKPSWYSLSYGDQIEYFNAAYWSSQGTMAFKLCKDKDKFKKMIEKIGLPTAQGMAFKECEYKEANEFAKQIGWPVVLKPHNELKGRGVCLMITNSTNFKQRWEELAGMDKVLLVEKMYFGKEYRIFVTDTKVVSVLERIPANVIGDGKHTISELIGIKDNDKIRNKCKSMDKIVSDEAVLRKLKKDGLTLESIPIAEQYIQLRYASNLSLGGDSNDATEGIHPSVRKMAINAVRAIPGLRYGGLDFMTEDITVDQKKVSHAIIEMNGSPGIDANHYPLLGKPRDCAGAILDIVFPKTKKK